MSDDIVTRLRDRYPDVVHPHILRDAELVGEAAAEIERLRALCNDLYHDATCSESFCRLCGEGIREWEASRD